MMRRKRNRARERKAWRRVKVRKLPQGWSELPEPFNDIGNGCGYSHTYGARVLCSCNVELDGKVWLHVSVAASRRLPTYEELCEVKEIFIGPDRAAVQIFAREAEHVNVHPNTLHLWSCLDGDPWPDFTRGNGIV